MEEECNVDVLLLNHDVPEEFGECMCQNTNGTSLMYLVILDMFSVYYFTVFISCFILSMLDKTLKLFIFFDAWMQALLFITSDFAIHSNVQLFYQSIEDYDDYFWDLTPWTCRVYWALMSAAMPSTILSLIFFWSQLYHHKIHILHIIMNSVTPVVAFIQFLLVAFPLRLLHFFFFVIFYVIYVIFTLCYEKFGGTGVDDMKPIYKLVDWQKPEKAFLICSAGLGIGLAAYFFFCFISMMKMACKHRNDYY